MIDFDVHLELDGLDKRFAGKLGVNGSAQRILDEEIKKDCSKKVPLDKGALQGSVHAHSTPGRVVWQTPYARRWYYEPARFAGAPERGNHWFERAKSERLGHWVDLVKKELMR